MSNLDSFVSPSTMIVKGGKGTVWEGVEDGKLIEKDMVFDTSYAPENAYVAILLEQDVNIDILVGDSGKTLDFWVNNWYKIPPAGRPSFAESCLRVGGGIDNDDFIEGYFLLFMLFCINFA